MPQETHGSPVNFSWMQVTGKLSFSGEKMPEYAKISKITPANIILIIR
jgi:hypothetical protein